MNSENIEKMELVIMREISLNNTEINVKRGIWNGLKL